MVHVETSKVCTDKLGDVTLDCDVLTVPGVDLRIVTYTAAPGTSGADQLDLLRASRRPGEPGRQHQFVRQHRHRARM